MCTVLQIIFFIQYNGNFHPFIRILETDKFGVFENMRMTVLFPSKSTPSNEDNEVPQSNPTIQESEILVEDRFPLSSNDIEDEY